jgi:hypothetical protein
MLLASTGSGMATMMPALQIMYIIFNVFNQHLFNMTRQLFQMQQCTGMHTSHHTLLSMVAAGMMT